MFPRNLYLPSTVYVSVCARALMLALMRPRNMSPGTPAHLSRHFWDLSSPGLCPYVELTDLIVGETTCDGKKKAYEIFDEITNKVYVMELPHKKASTAGLCGGMK